MSLLNNIYELVWGPLMLLLLLGNGLFLTIALRGVQFRYLFFAIKLMLGKSKSQNKNCENVEGDITHFESLMTALAASIGIGNIAGVATALTVGGLGALFWMWVVALIGMATKFGEALLAVKYRQMDDRGEMSGGPMYFIEKGLNFRPLALCFALFGAIAALGGGNLIQANSVAAVSSKLFGISPLYTGLLLALVTGSILIGGIKSIGKVASVLVPFMALLYVGGGCVILVKCYDQIPGALVAILHSAFNGQAAMGGFAGASVLLALQVGMSRGLMTSEAGLGTASIVAAAAKTDSPGEQAMVSMTGSFFSTILLCSVTALVLSVTGVFGSVGEDGAMVNGAELTMSAFESQIPGGALIVAIGLILFALTTLIGWAYYGEKCLEYLVGSCAVIPYRILFIAVIVPGAVLNLELVWKISDITNGLMAYPNLLGVTLLSRDILAETRLYLASIVSKEELFAPS